MTALSFGRAPHSDHSTPKLVALAAMGIYSVRTMGRPLGHIENS